MFFASDFSIWLMASLRHLPMSSKPQILPLSSTTGRCLYRFSIIMDRASLAESEMATQVGFGVMTEERAVVPGVSCFAATRLVISLSVMIPATPPSTPGTRAARTRLTAMSLHTSTMFWSAAARVGFRGRSFETGFAEFLPTLICGGGSVIGALTIRGVFAGVL